MAVVLDYSQAICLYQREQDAAHHAWPLEVMSGTSWRRGTYDVPLAKYPEHAPPYGDRYALFDSGQIPSCPLQDCKYCGALMTLVVDSSADAEWGHPDYRSIQVYACTCGWWNAEDVFHTNLYGDRSQGYDWQAILSQGILRRFDVASAEVPTLAIRQHLDRHPEDLAHINPRSLELLVGSVLRDHLDCEVTHVGRSNDGGIDLLLAVGNEITGVQVKRRSRPKAESVAFVREFIGALILRGIPNGLLVSTAPHFSRAAASAARTIADIGAVNQFDLIDGPSLLSILQANRVNADAWTVIAPTLLTPTPIPELLQ